MSTHVTDLQSHLRDDVGRALSSAQQADVYLRMVTDALDDGQDKRELLRIKRALRNVIDEFRGLGMPKILLADVPGGAPEWYERQAEQT